MPGARSSRGLEILIGAAARVLSAEPAKVHIIWPCAFESVSPIMCSASGTERRYSRGGLALIASFESLHLFVELRSVRFESFDRSIVSLVVYGHDLRDLI